MKSLRRQFLLLVAFFCGLAAAADAAKPNVLFILVDDMGWGDVGVNGGARVPTPRMDRLASEGTRFTQFYTASPICSASRCGFITGQYPARWRITSFLQTREGNRECEQADFLDAAAPSFVRTFQSAGYATAHIGKWHLGGGRDVTDAPGFAAYGYDLGLDTYEGDWKLLINADGTGAELYDLATDRNETKNLASEKSEIAKRLTAAALAWRKSLP